MITTRPARRDLIIRIGHSVRFARLLDTSVADAIWERLPAYGVAERTLDGTLAVVLELSSELTPPIGAGPLDRSAITYCLLTRRVVFPSMTAATNGALAAWARLAEPFAPHALDAVAHGARVSLLHADS